MSCKVIRAGLRYLPVILMICPRRDIKEETVRLMRSAASRVEVVWDVEAMAMMGRVMMYPRA